MRDGVLFIILCGLGFAGYGFYKFAIRFRTESAIEEQYRKVAWGDTEPTPNPYVLRNNRNLGLILIIFGIGLVSLGLAIGLLSQE